MSNKNTKKNKKNSLNDTLYRPKKNKNNPEVKKDMQQSRVKSTQYQEIENKNTNSDQLNTDSFLEAKIVSLQNEVADWKNKSIRLAADLQNLDKQNELDTAQLKKKIKKNTVDSIFSFLNTLQLSFNYKPESNDQQVNSFINTLQVSFDQVLNQLANQGIEIINVKPGDIFNPEFMTILSESGDGNTIVKQVVSVGLKIDNQIIQPASVMV
jgi:molecular chaperone GrpE